MELTLPRLLASSGGSIVFFLGCALATLSMTSVTPMAFNLARFCIAAAGCLPALTVCFAATQLQMPIWMRVVVLVGGLLVIGFSMVWLFKLVGENENTHSGRRVQKVVSRTIKLLKKAHHMRPLDAMRQAGAANLTNQEIIEASNDIARSNYGLPFSDAIPKSDYLSFLEFSLKGPLPLGTEPEIYDATVRFHLSSDHNPFIAALEELEAVYAEGDHLATLFQCKGEKLPTFAQAVAWNEKAIALAKRNVFSVAPQDWAKFKADWNFADCQRLERVLREHGCLEHATDAQCSTLRFLWGRVKRLGELIAKIKGLPAEENKTQIESLTDFLSKTHSLLDASANLARLLPLAERHDLIANIRQFLRKTAPEYVARFNEIVEAPPARAMEFPPDFTEDDRAEWTRTRRGPCDQLHAIAAYLTRIISDLRSKLPS